jgi:hypothetical protein
MATRDTVYEGGHAGQAGASTWEDALPSRRTTQQTQRIAPSSIPSISGGSVDQQLERFLAGLRQHESGNRNVPNSGGHSSASGYYQYINSTWNNYGGYARAIDAPFEVQHARAKQDALRAYNKFGNWADVAMNHFYPAFAGKPELWHMIPGAERGRTTSGNPPAINFVKSVLSKAGMEVPEGSGSGGGSGSTQAQATQYARALENLSSTLSPARQGTAQSPFSPIGQSVFSTLASYTGQQAQRAAQLTGDAMEPTFFDPYLSQLQRQLAFDTETGVADLQLQQNRLQEDSNLFRPYLERRFGNQANQAAEGVAGRGFHGSRSGIMRKKMGGLAKDQTYTMGQFERGTARGMEDIERAIANLTGRNTIMGAEGVREGAGRAAQGAYPQFPSF